MSRPRGIKNEKIHVWTREEKEYLNTIVKGKHYREIMGLMNEKSEYKFSLSQIKGAIGRYKLNTGLNGQFKKGSIPANKGKKGLSGANKTSFKKGNVPVNYRKVGSERVNVYGYIEIKVAAPNKWKLKHRVFWEKYNGEIPKGYSVIFGDGDKKNFDKDNLILVSRKQLMILNKNNLIQNDAELTKSGLILADIIIKLKEVVRENEK